MSNELSRKQSYLDTLELGSLIAFYNDNNTKYLSGKIIEFKDNDVLLVETSYKTKYFVNKKDIKWVKTGKRWPKGVYQMLKGEKENVEEKQKQLL